MKMLPLMDFLESFDKKVMKNRMDLSLYEGCWQCACGKTHYMIHQRDIICQGYWKVMVFCPEDRDFITSVKIKTRFLGFKFDGYDSLMGTHIENEAERFLLGQCLNAIC